ncbi:MAG TPA: AsmA family protein [Acidobacteriaceae bacterium]
MTEDPIQTTHPRQTRRRWWIISAVVILLLLILLPPYLTLNRYRHGIATSIGGSLGRPVHLDDVSLRLLPTPAFTLTNFVVGENPAFGYEPFMRANTVTASLHISSLWRGRLEFSTISLDEPSVNLVRNAAGEWNISSILLQAAQIHTAPTEQRRAGSVPRFPYIETTQARVNIKYGDEKMPFSLTDAKLALWLSQPETWHVRMEAHPVRTDMNAAGTGLLRIEGTFERAATLDAIPLQLSASWEKAQLGDVSRMLMRRDAGWRGAINASATVAGLFGSAQIDTKVHLDDVRRADFVAERTLSLDIHCTAASLDKLHAFDAIHCALPLGSGFLLAEGSISTLRGKPQPALQFTAQNIPAGQLLEMARHASNRIAPTFAAEGIINGVFTYAPITAPTPTKSVHNNRAASPAAAQWQGAATLPLLTLHVPGVAAPITVANLHLHTLPAGPAGKKHHDAAVIGGAVLDPVQFALGAPSPAVMDGLVRCNSVILHLRGGVLPSRLLALAKAVPQLGDGVEAVLPAPPTPPEASRADRSSPSPIYLDTTAQRTWNGLAMEGGIGPLNESNEAWTTGTPHKPAAKQRH